ncbi:MAG: hypothetical protein IJP89_06635 [Synergistaceae bacterium]|nr:hypothetical protein [Synergistaceae bacterium]
MPRWKDLRRFLDRNGQFVRHGGDHDVYRYNGKIVRVSRSSGEIESRKWRDILKHQLHITQEDFNRGL